ncbi:MAG: glycosyltransferase family 1 protein [Veillonella caviae]|nr:glycosyltransferase family 1 protein [Veillonella caviae]
MRVAILESIIMPAGHEVEFDRILVNELKAQGHEPVFWVPENFPFKIDYKAPVEYLAGGEVVTYAGASRFQKLFLSVKREVRRRRWFNSAYEKIKNGECDCVVIPTSTFRYLKALLQTKLKDSPVPVYFIVHGINPREKARFVKQVRRCEKYKNIHIKIITLRDDFGGDNLTNIDLIAPPVFKPVYTQVEPSLTYKEPITLGFFGQYRREKNVRFFLNAFKKAQFTVPVKLIVQGATAMQEDAREFEAIIEEYKNTPNLEFWHKNLIGPEWEDALLSVDAILAPYGAERYRYHWSAMLFNAIGYYKPILQSPEINPEVVSTYDIGEVVDLTSEDIFAKQLELFVNGFKDRLPLYEQGLQAANAAYSQAELIRHIIGQIAR